MMENMLTFLEGRDYQEKCYMFFSHVTAKHSSQKIKEFSIGKIHTDEYNGYMTLISCKRSLTAVQM